MGAEAGEDNGFKLEKLLGLFTITVKKFLQLLDGHLENLHTRNGLSEQM